MIVLIFGMSFFVLKIALTLRRSGASNNLSDHLSAVHSTNLFTSFLTFIFHTKGKAAHIGFSWWSSVKLNSVFSF